MLASIESAYIGNFVFLAKLNFSKHRITNIIARERCPLIRKMHLQTKQKTTGFDLNPHER